MHKDLSDEERRDLTENAERTASSLFHSGESLALAREAWINAFDKAAEDLDEIAAAMNTLLEIDGPLYNGGDNA